MLTYVKKNSKHIIIFIVSIICWKCRRNILYCDICQNKSQYRITITLMIKQILCIVATKFNLAPQIVYLDPMFLESRDTWS